MLAALRAAVPLRVARRALCAAAAVLAMLGVLALVPPAGAAPHAGLCTSGEGRGSIPRDFVLDACFDGSTLVLMNQLDIPVRVESSGSAGGPSRSSYAAPEPASLALHHFAKSDAGLLPPRYLMKVPVGAGAATLKLGPTDYGPNYMVLRIVSDVVPASAMIEIASSASKLTSELRAALDGRIGCERGASNWFTRSACRAAYVWDVDFAVGRFLANAGLDLAKKPRLVTPLITLVDLAFFSNDAASSTLAFQKGTREVSFSAAPASSSGARAGAGTGPGQAPQPTPPRDRPTGSWKGHIVQWDRDTKAQKTAWLVGDDGRRRWIPSIEIYTCLKNNGVPGPTALPAAVLDQLPDLNGVWATCAAPAATPAPRPSQPAAGSAPVPRVTAAPTLGISGSCTTAGGTLRGTSKGFTPGGTATIRAWYPDGRPYTDLVATSRVRDDGSIRWNWPCVGDPAGTYATEAVDDRSGASTGRLAFTIASADPPAPASAPAPAPPVADPGTGITVFNKVTNGPTAMREDAPAYLSTAPRNFCRREGCVVPGTERGTGGTYAPAVCQVAAARTTNGNDGSPADDGNPGLFSSTRWYGIRLPSGGLGYISEVWIDGSQRERLGLPAC